MKLIEAIKILRKHNDWRRGKHDEQETPSIIGEALDNVLDYIEMELEDAKYSDE
jgi:hypothetical protein